MHQQHIHSPIAATLILLPQMFFHDLSIGLSVSNAKCNVNIIFSSTRNDEKTFTPIVIL